MRHLTEMERAYAVRALGPDGGLQWVWGDYVDGGPEWDIDATSRWSRRWNLLKLIGEYARHNGHADIIRERINGQAGE